MTNSNKGTNHDTGGSLAAPGVALSGRPDFELKAVGFAASGRQILHPLDLSLTAGRIYGLVGPNGSGKSTLTRILARQQPSSGGQVLLGGQSISTLGDRDFARRVAYMPQFTPPAEGMNVRELVGLGRFPWHGALGRFGAADAAMVAEALAATDLTGMAGRMVDSLSGGERQRAWLAMMVAQDTGWLLLDEPTSALDIAHQVDMLALVRRLGEERGVGVVIVIHDINMAARFCDEIIALREGRVVAHGAPRDILDSAVLDRIYGLPMGIFQIPGRTSGQKPGQSPGIPVSYVL